MTRRMGNSFVQLLAISAVLIALGLAGAGGGIGCTRSTAVDEERRGICGEGGDSCCGFGGGGNGPLDEPGRLIVVGLEGVIEAVYWGADGGLGLLLLVAAGLLRSGRTRKPASMRTVR